MKKWPDGCTLTPEGVFLFAKLKSLPEVEKETILDRSKADDLVKGLACSQALWIIIQVIARKASGLPVTLLELNTVAHVVCAILMYIVWWYKPQNVNQPESVHVEPELEALLSPPETFVSGFWGKLGIPPRNDPQSDMATNPIANSDSSSTQKPTVEGIVMQDNADWRHAVPENTSGIKVTGVVDWARSLSSRPEEIRRRTLPNGVVMLLPGQGLEGSLYTAKSVMHLNNEDVQFIQSISKISGLRFLETTLEVWFLEAYVSRQASNIIIQGDVIDDVNVADKLSDMLWPKSLGRSLPMLAILSIFYGGLHASSWNGHFPTAREQLLWRIASCIVAGGGLLLWTLNFVYDAWLWDFGNLEITVVWGLFCATFSVVFAAARFYLVIESFISVRNLPVGAFSTVVWVNFLPHIG